MTAARNLRVASVQMEHRDGDREANFAKLEAFVAQGGRAGSTTGGVPRMLRVWILVHPQLID